MRYWISIGGIAFIDLLLLGILVFLAQKGRRTGQERKALGPQLLLAFVALLTTLLLLELGMKLFYIRSDSINLTLASQAWMEKYWHPINALGYRDQEWQARDVEGKKVVAVVGDSFAAGHGIERIEDRFSNRLGEKLGDDYETVTIAQLGWATRAEYAGLIDHPVTPDIVVLSYYLNDILPTARTTGQVWRPTVQIQLPNWAAPIVNHSYLVNFLYWRLIRWQVYGDYGRIVEDFTQYLVFLYGHEETWRLHKEELELVVQYAKANDIDLFVVVFPDLTAVEATTAVTREVATVFTSKQIPTLDLSPMLTGWEPEDLIVHKFDGHPSIELHEFVAEKLYLLIRDDQ